MNTEESGKLHRSLQAARTPHRNNDPVDADGWIEDQACSCPHYVPLAGPLGADWGVIMNPESLKFGQVVFEHEWCGCGPHSSDSISLYEQQLLQERLDGLLALLRQPTPNSKGETVPLAYCAQIGDDSQIYLQPLEDGTISAVLNTPDSQHAMIRGEDGKWHALTTQTDPARINYALTSFESLQPRGDHNYGDARSFFSAWQDAGQLILWLMELEDEPKLEKPAQEVLRALGRVNVVNGDGWPQASKALNVVFIESEAVYGALNPSGVKARGAQERIERAYLYARRGVG